MTNDFNTDQLLNPTSIRHFLTRTEYIFLFLILTGVMTVLLVVFGQPTSLTGYTEQLTRLTPLGQIALCFTSGFVTLILSRTILFFVNRSHKMTPGGLAVWIFSELIICVSVITLVLWALGGGGAIHLASVVGTVVLGFVGLLLIPSVITYLICRLHETSDELIRIRQILNQQGPNLPSPSDSNVNFYAKGGRLALSTKMSNILFIEAADNYCNIHYLNGEKEDTFILFNSMKNIEKTFVGTSLMRCHRGYMVNVENVKLMRKDGSGLLLELDKSDKVVSVSKSFSGALTQYFANNTRMPLPTE